MLITAAGRALVRLGVVALFVAALASVWEVLALQSPGTPLYLGMLPGPVASLREMSTTLGLLLVGAGLTQHWARGRGDAVLVLMLYAGTVLGLGGQVYAAARGMAGVQLQDLRADALPLFAVKFGGFGLVLIALLEHGRRLLFRDPQADGGSLREQAFVRGRAPDPRGPSARQLDPGGRDH
jgi:hypothetical protein